MLPEVRVSLIFTGLFHVLEMHDTGFSVDDSKLARFSPLYSKSGEGMVLSESAEESGFRNPQVVPYGGGGLVSTGTDYLRFAQMLINGGELDGIRLLSHKTVELMMMNHLDGTIGERRLKDDWLSKTENRTGEKNLGLGYGLGGYVITDLAANSIPGSIGTYSWGGAASTYFFIDPREKLIGLFLTQLRPSSSYPLRAEFRSLVYQAIID